MRFRTFCHYDGIPSLEQYLKMPCISGREFTVTLPSVFSLLNGNSAGGPGSFYY